MWLQEWRIAWIPRIGTVGIASLYPYGAGHPLGRSLVPLQAKHEDEKTKEAIAKIPGRLNPQSIAVQIGVV